MDIRDKMSQLPARELSDGDKAVLASVLQNDGYRVLLDIMHRFVVEQETFLMNEDATNSPAVLAAFYMAKTAWMLFARVQTVVSDAAEDVKAWREKELGPPTEVSDRSDLDILGFE